MAALIGSTTTKKLVCKLLGRRDSALLVGVKGMTTKKISMRL
ncbi:MAG: hypothetical protein ABFC84_07100 [Veillonellales bacterium]